MEFSDLDFGYWIKGLVPDWSAADVGAMVLKKAAEILDKRPLKAAPPQMTAIRVPQFCIHNINVAEYCVGCCGKYAAGKMRSFAVTLPIGTPLVYIPVHGDTTSGDSTDSGTPEAAERT